MSDRAPGLAPPDADADADPDPDPDPDGGGWPEASWGKRRFGLRVVRADREHASRWQVAGRNAVKLLPWQLAHMSVSRMILGADEFALVGTTYALSLLIPVVSILMARRDGGHRALHDRIAGTRVVVG